MNCLAQNFGNMSLQNFIQNRGYDEIPIRPIDRLEPLRKDENKRRNTFKNYPRNAKIDMEELLADGFFYIGDGENDRVQCAFCGGILKNWRRSDDVHAEHKRIFDRCPLVNGIGFLNHGESHSANFSNKNQVDGGQAQVSNLNGDDVEADIAPSEDRARHPKYSLKHIRLNTFKDWPKTMNQKPDDLAEAGLFYTGEADKTLCYHCGGALVDWEPEDIPAPEHDHWFPDCMLAEKRKSGN